MNKNTTRLGAPVRADRQKNISVERAVKVPTPPRHLSADAKKVYRKICNYLIENNSLATVDMYFVAAAADCYDNYVTARKAMDGETNGVSNMFQKSPNGYVQQSPYYTIMNNERASFMKFAKSLGLNTYARELMNSFQTKTVERKDPALRWLGGGENKKVG